MDEVEGRLRLMMSCDTCRDETEGRLRLEMSSDEWGKLQQCCEDAVYNDQLLENLLPFLSPAVTERIHENFAVFTISHVHNDRRKTTHFFPPGMDQCFTKHGLVFH